jgi:hypothetical protein
MNASYRTILSFDKPSSVELSQCVVIALEDQCPVVMHAGSALKAKTAFSCLVKPEPGDLVVCSFSSQGCYILGIIERPENQQMDLVFPADVNLQAGSGKLGFFARDSITQVTNGQHTVIAKNSLVSAQAAQFTIDQVTARGSNLVSSYTNITVIGQAIDTMVKRLIQRVKTYIRHAEDYDQVKAGNMTRDVKGLYSLDTCYTVMVSKKDTKIDGERIHMA